MGGPASSFIVEVILMAYTKATMRAVDKYVKNNYDRIEIKVPKGRKQAVEAHARERGESVNGLVNALLRAEMGLSEDEWRQGQMRIDGAAPVMV